jgi:hypothetical protein
MSLKGKRRYDRLVAMAEPEPEVERRRIRVPKGERPDPAAVEALVAQGFAFAHTARVGFGTAELDWWYTRVVARPGPPRPIRRRKS